MMMLAKIRIVAACVAAAVVAGAIVAPFAMSALAEGAEGTEGGPEKLAGSGKVINPWGEVASPLVREVMKKYGIEHGEVKFREEGAWIFGSENSAVVAMETTLRTDAVLEYGESTRYGAKLADDGLHYIHIFHLKGLEPDTAYHVRMTCTDRWGKKAASKDLTVRTKTIANAVRIPGDLNGPPYELGQANAYYLVTEDISTPRTAFNFSASNVTLDLGAHTITYNEEHMDLPTNSYNNQRKQSAFGARIWGRGVAKARVVNGTIAQGKGNDKSTYTGIGFNPIYCTATGSEIAGVTCIYSGQQMCGIHMHSGNAHSLHHNIIHDKGRRIFDRHKSVAGIKMFGGENHKVYNNLIKLARQVAIGGGAKNSEFNNNEVHVVSYSVNGGGVGSKASVVHDNKIFGCGCNVVASAATGGTSTKFYRNYVWLHAHDLSKIRNFFNRGETGGVLQSSDVSIMSCARITWGCNGPRFR